MTATPANAPRVLVAGIGNIFLGDDAFGVEVAQQLLRRPRPEAWQQVRIEDFGIRGIDLVYALTDGYDVAVLIDAVPRGDGPPGTLYLLEPQLDGDQSANGPPLIEAHSMDPAKVLRMASAMGSCPGQIYIVGCEPTPIAAEEEGDPLMPMQMCPAVAAAVEEAVKMVQDLVNRIIGAPPIASEQAGRREVESWSR